MALGIGDTLREERRRQNRSLADAASSTRIREVYLAALEEEQFAALGGDVYVKGFLRSYAKYLGLDPEPLVDVYRQSHTPDEEQPLVGSRPVEDRASRGAYPAVLTALAGVVLVALALIGTRGGDDEGGLAASTAPTATPSQPAATAPAPPAGPTTPPPPPAPVPFTTVQAVVTVAGGPNYLRVDQGTPAYEGEMVDGERREFTGAPALELRLGNAGVVNLVVDGQEQGPLGRPGQVVDVICAPGATACTIEEITP
jgi:cytoskeleton protein RodZ